jgi:hypothetical protein
VSVESDLRQQLIDRYGPFCMWPGCKWSSEKVTPFGAFVVEWNVELMHFHSKGMGGHKCSRCGTDTPRIINPTADLDTFNWAVCPNVLENNGLGCSPGHAQMSDGERVAGFDYDKEHAALFDAEGGIGWELGLMDDSTLGWARAEALSELARRR